MYAYPVDIWTIDVLSALFLNPTGVAFLSESHNFLTIQLSSFDLYNRPLGNFVLVPSKKIHVSKGMYIPYQRKYYGTLD